MYRQLDEPIIFPSIGYINNKSILQSPENKINLCTVNIQFGSMEISLHKLLTKGIYEFPIHKYISVYIYNAKVTALYFLLLGLGFFIHGQFPGL